jgi:long-chain fatty acid transport protein
MASLHWCAHLILAASAGTLLVAGTARGQAGGLYLPENGGATNGTAQAGSGALARDAETAWLNPAGMTRLEAPTVILSFMPVNLHMQFNPAPETTASGSDGGNQGGWIPAGGLFVAYPVSQRVALGFSATSPAGLVIDPADDWVGRAWMTEALLVALNLEPSVGVRLSSQFSLGAGFDIQYLTFEQKLVGPAAGVPLGLDGDSWDVGFSASALWEPLATTRVGARYRSQVSHNLSGDMTVLESTAPVSTSFTLPMSATLSTYHEFSQKVALMLDAGWTDWSAFDYNVVTFDGSGAQVELARNFKDTWNVSLGSHVSLAQDWIWMLGGGYVSSAVDDENRTPDLPVDQQIRGSTGIEYGINSSWTVGASYMFLYLGKNKIDQTRPLPGRVVGDYDAYGHVFGLYGALWF